MVRRGTSGYRIAGLALIGLLLLGGSLQAQESDRSQLLDMYRQAFEAYDRGDMDTASALFERIMHSDPSESMAIEIRERIMQRGVRTFAEMMSRGGNIGQFAEYILDKSNLGGIERITDAGTIGGWVRSAVESPAFEERWAALIKLDAKVGPHAVPFFVPYLVSNNENFKTNAIVSLRHMSEQVTLPVIQILHAQDPELRRTAAIILGHLKDTRALPALAKVAQNPNEDRIVVRYAEEAIVNTAGQEALSVDFKVHYLRTARMYYHHDPAIMVRIGQDEVVWEWDESAADLGSKLKARPVPTYLYNEIEAERACWAVLSTDPRNIQAWALLVSSNFAQVIETQKILEAVGQSEAEKPPESEMEMLERNDTILSKAEAMARSAGVEVVYEALDLAIKDRRSVVGVHCIQALQEMESRYNDPGKALISALHTSDKRLRYAAALALAHIDPLRAYAGSKDVVPTLEAALGESGTRSILVITDEQNARNAFQTQLEQMGYAPYFADTGWDGVERAHRFPGQDLIILDTRLGVHPIDVRTGTADPRMMMEGGQPDDPTKSYERGIYYVRVLEMLERDYRTKNVPVVLLVDPANQEQVRAAAEGGKHHQRIKGFIVRPVARENYADVLSQVFGETGEDNKSKSSAVATEAAMALASLDVDHSIYKVEEATKGLLEVLDKNAPELDALRTHALVALANVGHPRAIPSILRVFQDPASSVPLRVAAAESMGVIYQKNKLTPEPDAMEAFQNALASNVTELQIAAAHALGRARVEPGARWNYYQANPVRVEPASGAAEGEGEGKDD